MGTNKWGDCDDSATTSCAVENINVASCSTSQGQCVFPFRYKGIVYNGCTSVDSSGVHVNGEGKYGICGTDCNPTISLASILAGLGINTQTRAAQLTQSQDVNFNVFP